MGSVVLEVRGHDTERAVARPALVLGSIVVLVAALYGEGYTPLRANRALARIDSPKGSIAETFSELELVSNSAARQTAHTPFVMAEFIGSLRPRLREIRANPSQRRMLNRAFAESFAAFAREIHRDTLNDRLYAREGALFDDAAQFYESSSSRQQAIDALHKAIELSPTWAEPYIRLGSLYASSGQYDQALAKLKDAAKADPQNQATLMVMGVLYEQRGDIPRARETYEQLLAINPRFVPAANNLAWIYAEHGGDKEKALQLAQMAKEGAPDDPRVSDTLGWILYKRGIYQNALALLKESAAKLGNNPQVQYHLGMVYAQLGDQANARKALNSAIGSV